MERIKDLEKRVADFVHYCEQAQTAESQAEVDEAKVRGLIAFNELMKQVNRSRVTLIELTRDRRAYLNDRSFHEARQTVRRVLAADKPVATNEIQLTPETSKSNTAKSKKTKKVKK